MSLDLQHTIQKLQRYRSGTSFPILSVYLEIVEPHAPLVRYFHDLVEKSLDKKQQSDLKENIEYIESYLEEYEPSVHDQGIAIFSGNYTLWEAIPTLGRLPNFLEVSHSPYLKPLLKEFADYRRFLVIVADRQKARLLTLYSGQIETEEEIDDDTVPQAMKGHNVGERSDKVDRHIQEHLHRHLQLISKKVNEFVKFKPITYVLVGGHKEIIHDMEKHLPKRLREKIIGEFVAEPDVNINTILNKSRELVERLNRHLNHNYLFS